MTNLPHLIRALCLSAFLVPLTACDPGVHIGYQKDFDGPIDIRCIDRALGTVVPDFQLGGYTSDGGDFPSGTLVTQFYYSDPILHNSYSLDVAPLPNGKTRYVHQWSKIGTDIPADERAKILPLLIKANDAVARQCGLSFAGSLPEVGAG